MKKHFILDTNAYRQVGKNRSKPELRPTANELRKRGEKLDSKSLMSIVVSMELLKHFDQTDPFFRDCFNALTIQCFHTQTTDFGQPGNNIDFIPPLNTLLTAHFFNDNSPLYKHYLRIIEIIVNATEKGNPVDYVKDQYDINLVTEQLIFDRKEVQQNLEEFIKDTNGGEVDWLLFRNNKNLRIQLLKDIKTGSTADAMAISFCKRAHSLLELPFPQPDIETKLGEFVLYYAPMLKLCVTAIIEKLIHGVVALADPLNEKWNTINDIQILGAACSNAYFHKGKVQTIIVTDDKAISEACRDTYMDGNVWNLKKYLSYIY